VTGNSETCNISPSTAGTYYIMVRAYSSYTGVKLTGSYTP
jgi:xanthomonalisin